MPCHDRKIWFIVGVVITCILMHADIFLMYAGKDIDVALALNCYCSI